MTSVGVNVRSADWNSWLGRAALTLALGVALVGCQRGPAQEGASAIDREPPPPLSVETAPATTGRVTVMLELTGTMLPVRRAVLMSEVDGRIAEIPAAKPIVARTGTETRRFPVALGIGQAVAEGQIVVRIDDREHQLALLAAKARLARARSDVEALLAWRRPEQVRVLQERCKEAQARLQLAKLQRERAAQLLQRRVGTQRAYDEAQMAMQTAEATLRRERATLDLAQAGPRSVDVKVLQAAVKVAEAEVEQAQLRIDRCVVKAPFAGVISEFYVEVGERVTSMPRVEILELLDVATTAMQVGVPEQYLHRIAVGDLAEVLTAAQPEPTRGLVVRINNKVDPVTRTFRVRVAVDNGDGRFVPGQFGRVRFRFGGDEQVLIPRAAITHAEGQPQVFCLGEGGVVRARRVRLGLDDGEQVEVLEGLEAGVAVVTDDPAVLADGMRVQPKDSAR